MSEEAEVEVVKDMPKTRILKKGDKIIYFCKKCKQEFESEEEWRRHLHQCRDKRSDDETDTSEQKLTKERRVERKILTPEEEMIEEMCEVLHSQMEATPGIGGGQKTEWFVNVYFRNNPVLQENPQELFKALRRHFPKADDDAISWIVSAVFKVREKYKRSNLSQPYQMPILQPQQTASLAPNMSIPANNGSIMSWMFMMMQQMMQQQQQFYQMLLDEAKNKPDPDAIRAQVENEYLKRQLERLEQQLDRMTEMIAESKPRSISPEGWKDDYARLIAEMGDKILSLGERIIVENKKFRQTLVKYLAPRFIKREETEILPSGEGRTDEEIVEELEKEGLVEGE